MNTWGLNDLAKVIYDANVKKGWHSSAPDLAKFLVNLHSEISELWEAYRADTLNAPCDKAEKMQAAGIEPLTCIEEEIADILIRALDTALAFGVDIESAVTRKMAYNATRPFRHGGKLA